MNRPEDRPAASQSVGADSNSIRTEAARGKGTPPDPGRRLRPWAIGLGAVALAVLVGLLAIRRGLGDEAIVRQLIESGRYAEAEARLAAWLRSRPDSGPAHSLRARLLWHRDDAAGAAQAAARARTLGAVGAELDRLEGLALERSGRMAEAEPKLLAALRRSEGRDPEVAEALARYYLSSYQLRRASEILDRWAVAAPDDPRPLLWMTEVDERVSGGHERALAHYTEALRRDPTLDRARLGMAESLRKADRLEEAARAFEAYLDRHPDDPEALLGAARADIPLGEHERAQARLTRLLESDPDHAEALRETAAVAMARGDAPAALGQLDRTLAAAPFDAETHYRRGLALDRLGRAEEAAEAKARAARLREDEARLLQIRARLNEDPGNLQLRLEIARWMMEHGQGREGVRWAQTILARDPEHPGANDLLSVHHREAGEAGLANFYRLQAEAGRSRGAAGSD